MQKELDEIVEKIIKVADTYFTNPDGSGRIHAAGMAVDRKLIQEMERRNEKSGWAEKYCLQ